MYMKKTIFALSLLTCCFSLSAENLLSIEDVNLTKGEVIEVPITITNSDPIAQIAMDIVVPSELQMTGLTKKLDADHFPISYNINKASNTLAVIVMNSVDDFTEEVYLVEPGTTTLVTLKLKALEDFSGSIYFANSGASLENGPTELKYPIGKFGSKGYSSFSASNINKIVGEGVTAYYGKIDDLGEKVTLDAFPENIVPAKTGAVLKGKEGETIYAVAQSSRPAVEMTSDLLPTTTSTTNRFGMTVEAESVHVLSTVDNKAGFYLYEGTSLPANKAYIPKGRSTTNAPIRIEFENETGISDIMSDEIDGVVFNLQGQKVNEVKKGIYVVNGKKVMF